MVVNRNTRAAEARAAVEQSRSGREHQLREVRSRLRELGQQHDDLISSVHRDEMARTFSEVPESVTNTQLVAEMCDLAIPFPKGSERYPKYPLPPEVKTDRTGYLKELCITGLKARYGVDYAKPEKAKDKELAKTLVERLDYEISIIAKTGFVDYFLVVWDFIDWAKKQQIPVGPGRGSGAGCIVAYVLGITNLDPLRFKLLFERFLSEGRVGRDGHPSWPDIDLDLPSGELREQVIQRVYEAYAPRGAAMTANVMVSDRQACMAAGSQGRSSGATSAGSCWSRASQRVCSDAPGGGSAHSSR